MLIRLHGCAGWSAPFLFASPPSLRSQVFSCRGPYDLGHETLVLIVKATREGSGKPAHSCTFTARAHTVTVMMCSHMHDTLVQSDRCKGRCTIMQIRNPVVCDMGNGSLYK